jgi:hypothetical protein
MVYIMTTYGTEAGADFAFSWQLWPSWYSLC